MCGRYRRAFNEGGTASSKTWTVLQILTLAAQNAKSPLLISVVSESFPHLRRGCIRDFFTILGESQDNNPRWSKTDHVYSFGHGVIEFFSLDEPDKARGGRRDILFLNEANNNQYDSYLQLDMRTKLFTFADWNPTSEFWVHEKGLLQEPENCYIHSTYQDAIHVLPPETVMAIEKLKTTDPNAWRIYGLGLMGKIEGLVYPNFGQCDALPPGDLFYGLDFGFSGDPAVLTRHVIQGEDLYSEEMIYQTGLTNQDLATMMKGLGVSTGRDEIWADSAEPKSIEEIHRYGFNIKPVAKGKDSVEYGHQRVRQYRQHWTKGSVNCIKEQRNFRYVADKDGRYTEKTMHLFSHGMDSRRYAIAGKTQPAPVFMVGVAA
jgi:phage terminase large subunit